MAKAVTLRPIHPNQGVEADYQRRLDRKIAEMNASLLYWLKAAYRANEPEIASDESPAMALRNSMRQLAKRWTREFGKLAEELGPTFVRSAAGHTDRSFAAALKKAGFTVKFRTTPAINDVIQASVGENVALIKSIASQHLGQVEGAVMRSVQQGRDLSALASDLEDRFGVVRRRAAFISLDQNNKITAAITRARQEQLGLQAKWRHSGGGKHPRPTHLAMNSKQYDPAKGMWDPAVQRFIRPGEEPHCRCISVSIVPGFS